MKWLVITGLTLFFTPLTLFSIGAGVFAFSTHQNSCNHDASMANNNPCCLLHKPTKSISFQTYQWYGLKSQSNLSINIVNSQAKLGYALGMTYQQIDFLKLLQMANAIGFACAPNFLIGIQLNGNHRQWHNFKGFKINLNIACQWQINKQCNWIALIEQVTVLDQKTAHQKALPILSMAFQKELISNLVLQMNMANSAFGELKIGGHILIQQENKQWIVSLSDNLQQCGFAIKSKIKKHWDWGIGCLYHWQLGLSSNSQLSYAF